MIYNIGRRSDLYEKIYCSFSFNYARHFAGCSRADTSEDVSYEKPVAEHTTIIESTTDKKITESETTTQESDN